MVSAAAGLVLGSLAGLEPPAIAAQVDKFAAEVAREHGIPVGRLEIGDKMTQHLPDAGSKLDVAKVLDTGTGKAYLAAFDEKGKRVNPQEAAAKDAEARQAKNAKIDPGLREKLDKAAPNEPVSVSIWVNSEDPPVRRGNGATPEAVEQQRTEQLSTVRDFMRGKRRGVVNEVARIGGQPVEPDFAPAVFATLNRGQIERLARNGDVNMIYGSTENARFQDDAATTERAYPVWQAGNLGFSTSSRPIIHEDDGVAEFNPYLGNANHAVVFWCSAVNATCPNGKGNTGAGNAHASEVAGAISSTHPLHRGIAPNAQLILSANSQNLNDDAKNVAAYEWARGNGGDPVNMSWGQSCPNGAQTFISRYIDWAVRTLGSTFTISSGNTNGCASNDTMVSSPGVAWSAITVGSQFDQNSGHWTGDGMSGFSRHINPTFAAGMEKPEVVAVGENVRTTDNAGGDHLTAAGINGTSFSAPQVAGQVASMLARQPGQNGWPETNKATVLTSAWHDVTTGTGQDGVGSIVVSASDDTYRLGRFRNDCGAGCGPLVTGDFPRSYPVNLTAGQVVRAAIAYDSWSTGGAGTDQLGADLDLQILKPDGTFLAASVSVQNAWELVQFTAPVTGTYSFQATHFSSVAGWPGTFLGMAYSIQSIPTFCTGLVSLPATGGTYTINTANGPTFFDSYAGWAPNQSGREHVARLVLSTTKDITFTDTSASLDLHVVQMGCTAAVPTVKGNGANSVFVDNAPAGTYYLVADGLNGAVGTATGTVTVSGP